MRGRVCAQEVAARTSTPKNRQPIVVERPNFVMEGPPQNEIIGHSPDPRGFEARITPLNGLSNSEPRPAAAKGGGSRRVDGTETVNRATFRTGAYPSRGRLPHVLPLATHAGVFLDFVLSHLCGSAARNWIGRNCAPCCC